MVIFPWALGPLVPSSSGFLAGSSDSEMLPAPHWLWVGKWASPGTQHEVPLPPGHCWGVKSRHVQGSHESDPNTEDPASTGKALWLCPALRCRWLRGGILGTRRQAGDSRAASAVTPCLSFGAGHSHLKAAHACPGLRRPCPGLDAVPVTPRAQPGLDVSPGESLCWTPVLRGSALNPC